MSDLIVTRDEGHVRTIIMNRAEKKNAINDELAWGVIGAIEEAAKDDNVWVIALTGSGDAFCAGLDLSGSGEPASPLSPQSQQ
ncbi:MAG: enoyl-CoA hydratase-related protein, partial [Gammaproteobacteria bacterium]|nr:enoyl-CoA hydratase-related protein [Gammaproteobacteria bacterium]